MGRDKLLGVICIAIATILLGLVTFGVPYLKSFYLLRIDISQSVLGLDNPYVTLGVLGYCTDLQKGLGLQCSPANIGYSISVPLIIEGTLPSILSDGIDIATAALTRALVLHIVAFVFALTAFGFSLLAYLGIPCIAECCADLLSGFAAVTSFAIFIFDLACFDVIKRRVNHEAGVGSAVMGSAIWLTFGGMLLLFITPIMFLVGRCCGCANKILCKVV
ncbi:actin cortical patch SUR7/pH-response regulator pali [Mycena olivaceomarginata]|nr:actin cortical patch SUR7/pH-response regulator pali [Mycena olivaceomarginata]